MDRTKEFEPMQLQYTVSQELGAGYGPIDAPRHVSDEEAQEMANELRTFIEMIESGVGCGCIDGRCVIHTLDGKESMVGEKTAGGAAITGLVAGEVSGIFGDKGNVYDHFSRTINMLEDGEETPVRFHIDSDHEKIITDTLTDARKEIEEMTTGQVIQWLLEQDMGKSTGCGMDDQLEAAFSNFANVPRQYKVKDEVRTETQEQVKSRLEFIKGVSRMIKGEAYSDEVFDAHVTVATERVKDGFLKDWNSRKALILADHILRSRGVENGIFSRLEVLEASDEGVHGHIEGIFGVGKRSGVSLNQSRYFRETGKQAFWYDEPVADKIADVTARSAADLEAEKVSISQAVTETNLAAGYQLVTGTQRAVIYA